MIFAFVFVFVRSLKHKSGKIYVQVVSKATGRYKVLKSFGSCDTFEQQELLHFKDKQWINENNGVFELDSDNEKALFNNLLISITSLKLSPSSPKSLYFRSALRWSPDLAAANSQPFFQLN